MELTGRQIRISVRNLVEFVLRSGDIDNRRTAGAQKEAMLAGGRMHRKIQRRMGSGYQAEVSLRHSVEEDGFQIVVEGRADGIIRDGKDVTIDEIKCVYQDVLEKMFIIQESKRLAKSELKRANWKLGFRFSFADLKR